MQFLIQPAVTFTGYSNSGKTTVVSAVIKELSAHGYCVTAIKHDGHGHPSELSEKTLINTRHQAMA